jgi:hypothetical protein
MTLKSLKTLSLGLVWTLGLSACGNHGVVIPPGLQKMDPQKKVTPSNQTGKQNTCPVPFAMEEAGLTPLTERGQFPQAKFVLKEVQLHQGSATKTRTFTAVAKAEQEFKVDIVCDAVPDEEGKETLTGSFRAASGMDLLSKTREKTQREIEVAFEDGKLVQSISRIISDPNSHSDSDELDQIPAGRIEVGKDSFLTLKIYGLADGQLDFRMMWEGPADETGARVVQYSRATYEAVEQK